MKSGRSRWFRRFRGGFVAPALFLLLLVCAKRALPEEPYLLGDLVSGPGWSGDSFPGGWIEDGGRTFFQADRLLLGREYFVTEGTAESTFLLADTAPGGTSTNPEPYGLLGGRLFWWAYSQEKRPPGIGQPGAVWTSDGTPEGTVQVVPAGIAVPSTNPPIRGGAFAGDLLYFFGCSVEECSLWASDGTISGTQARVRLADRFWPTASDIVAAGDRVFFLVDEDLWTYSPGSGATLLVSADGLADPPAHLAAVGPTVFFSMRETNEEEHLWKSDGTLEGTVPVSSLPGGRDVWAGHQISGSELFFVAAEDGGGGLEIWRTDGSEAGTVPVTHFEIQNAIDRRYFVRDFLVKGQRVFVRARSESDGGGDSVWVADGSVEGTRDVAGCGGGCRVASRLAPVEGGVVFVLGLEDRLELWFSGGTAAETGPLEEVCTSLCSSHTVDLHPVGTEIGFSAGGRAWLTDGTAAGTRAITGEGQPEVARFGGVGRVGDCFLFSGRDHRGEEPWCSDGTPASVRLVADLEQTAAGSDPEGFADAGARAVFRARGEDGVRRIWASDGRPGVLGPVTGDPAATGVDLLGTGEFALYDRVTAPDLLWRTDGTESGTFPLGPFDRWASVIYRHRVYSFGWLAGALGIWEIDGTPRGPQQVTPLSTVLGTLPFPKAAGDLFYFIGIEDEELWRSDGTAEGTFPLTSLAPDAQLTAPLAIATLNDQTYFVVNLDGFGEDEIWRTDGTAEGTGLVASIPGFRHHHESPEAGLFSHGGALWFVGTDDDPEAGGRGTALYRLTEQGRTALARSPEDNRLPRFAAMGEKLFFTFNDDVHGDEPWWSDGTESGTAMLADLHSGGGSGPSGLISAGDRVYFAALSNRYGAELWRADSSGRVELVKDLAPGVSSSSPHGLTVVDDILYFSASTAETGREPWALRLDGSEPPDPPDMPLPPPGPFLTSPAVPGFRFKVRISTATGSLAGRAEASCIPETLCVSGALPGRSEVFLRVVGPKPNGRLWPTLVKFSTSRVEVWIEQIGSSEIRYYDLAAAAPGLDELPGLFDREGFLP